MLLRGYTMQRFEVFEGHRLSDIPKLFYAIKGIEQYFIKRESDPLYIEVTSYLEQIIEMVRLGYPDAIQTGHEALDRAQMALQNIFPGDKTLTLLIRALEGSLALSQKDFVELNPEVESCQKPQELN
jgi:hypothetical protein